MGKEFQDKLREAMKKDLAAREVAKEELRRVSCGTEVKKTVKEDQASMLETNKKEN